MKARTITISREYGSGGRAAAQKLAEKLGITCYDNEVISLAAKDSDLQPWEFHMAEDLKNTNFIYAMSVIRVSSDAAELSYAGRIFQVQSEAMRKLAAKGPAIFLGRCGNYVLRSQKDAVHFVLCGSAARRAERAVTEYGLTAEDAEREVRRMDRQRAAYFGANTNWRWGDGAHYDLVINTDRLGVEGAVQAMLDYLAQLE